MNVRRLALLLLSLATLPAHAARAPLAQSVDLSVPVPPAAVNVAGTPHLAYELRIANFQNADVTLERIDIVDERGAVIAALAGDELAARLTRPGAGANDHGRRVGAGRIANANLWLPVDDTPARLLHRVTLETGARNVVAELTLAVDARPPVVLDAPLRGGPWAAIYDPQMPRGHRTSVYTIDGRARIPARYAIDWIRVDERGARARDPADSVDDWYGYGEDVLAVADAVVADARDDTPLESLEAGRTRMALENASGNYVVLDVGDGRYVFYEHLRHGSVRVKTGDRVRRGDVIAALGNSGSSSSGPHLHFHVADANSLLGAEGMPYVFRDFEVLGAYESIAAFGRGEPWNESARRSGTNELPGPNTVIRFNE